MLWSQRLLLEHAAGLNAPRLAESVVCCKTDRAHDLVYESQLEAWNWDSDSAHDRDCDVDLARHGSDDLDRVLDRDTEQNCWPYPVGLTRIAALIMA